MITESGTARLPHGLCGTPPEARPARRHESEERVGGAGTWARSSNLVRWTPPWLDQLARCVAWGRVGIGMGAIVAPPVTARPWIGADAGSSASRLLARTMGGRDLALGHRGPPGPRGLRRRGTAVGGARRDGRRRGRPGHRAGLRFPPPPQPLGHPGHHRRGGRGVHPGGRRPRRSTRGPPVGEQPIRPRLPLGNTPPTRPEPRQAGTAPGPVNVPGGLPVGTRSASDRPGTAQARP